MSFLGELWTFLKVRKKLWLLPIILMMLVMGGLLMLAQGSAVPPHLYTLFERLRILGVSDYSHD